MLKLVVLVVLFYSVLIYLIIYIRNTAIKKALNSVIKPKIEAKGFTFISYKWLGYFNHGEFKDDGFDIIPSLTFGYPVTSTYIDVIYSDGTGENKITVRIDKSLLIIRKVSFSKEL